MRNRLEFAVAIQLLRTCRTVGKHSSEQKNHTWIIYNWAILYSSTLIGRGILYSLINIIIRTRATKIRSDVDRREKFSMACFNRRPETLVSHKSEMSKSRTACKLSAENKHNSHSAGRKPSWMTSRSIGTDGEPHFQIIENLWNRSQTGCPVIRQKWRRDTLWSKMRLKIHKRLCQSWSYVLYNSRINELLRGTLWLMVVITEQRNTDESWFFFSLIFPTYQFSVNFRLEHMKP